MNLKENIAKENIMLKTIAGMSSLIFCKLLKTEDQRSLEPCHLTNSVSD